MFKSENARLNGAAGAAQGYDRGHHFRGIATHHAWQRRALPSVQGYLCRRLMRSWGLIES